MDSNQLIIKMILDRWNGSVKNFDAFLNAASDEQLQREISPGKNRGIYILGHLIAVHDDMLPLMEIGDKLYPELSEPFIKAADKAVAQIPSATILRTYWKNQCEMLGQKFNNLHPDEWFKKHSAVSADEFSKEPHRNKLNILLTRTTHLSYHTGQIVLIK